MDFELSEEHVMLRQAIQDFAKNEITPIVDEAEEKEEPPRELFTKMGKLGYLSAGYPVEHGGGGMGSVGTCIVSEEVSRVSAGIASLVNSQMTLSTSIILDYGSEEQKSKYLIPALNGEKIAAFGMTEANAGSDAAAIETTAVRDGANYVINGSKIFTSGGPMADFISVLAYTDKSLGPGKGMSFFIVDKDTPGFSVSRHLKKMGMRSEPTGEESFEDCRVPADNLVGEEGRGFRYMLASLTRCRIPAAARNLGIAEAAYEAALDYAKNRVQFGQPIGKFQAISFKLARMATEIEAARWLVYYTAWLFDQGKECTKEASMAKLFSNEVAMHVTSEAMHIHGGYGLMMDSPLQRYFRDASFQSIMVGTTEIQESLIARGIGL